MTDPDDDLRQAIALFRYGVIADQHRRGVENVTGARNSLPSIHMRCMITPRRRASATFARSWPRRFATCMAHAFNHEHGVVRVSTLWTAS